jgi:hypothetical protein
MLSKADVEQYRKDGYVVAKSVLDKAELATLRGKLQELLEGARGLTGHTDVYDLEPFHKPDDPRVRRIKTPHKFFPLFREFAQNPKVLRILQQLLGPAVRLHGSKINIKAPQGGAAVEWHQDLGLLSAYQRRCPCGRRHARRLHDGERAADDPARHPHRASLRSSFRWLLRRRDRSGALRPRSLEGGRAHRTGGLDELASRPGATRLGPEHLDAFALAPAL